MVVGVEIAFGGMIVVVMRMVLWRDSTPKLKSECHDVCLNLPLQMVLLK